ncbi:MAG: toxin-antitoxin system HicB family antitoxin [bacterium]
MKKINDLDYFMSLPYTIETIQNDDKTYFIKVKELPGCMSEGDTLDEAYKMIYDAMKSWIEVALEEGDDIPLPENMDDKEYSGKLLVRIPKRIHKELSIHAKDNGVSLNSYINSLLSRYG